MVLTAVVRVYYLWFIFLCSFSCATIWCDFLLCPPGGGGAFRWKEVLGMCRGIGSHFHPCGKWITLTPFSNLYFNILVNQWVVIFFFSKAYFPKFSNKLQHFQKFKTNFAKLSQNRDKFLIFGKCMGPKMNGSGSIPGCGMWIAFAFWRKINFVKNLNGQKSTFNQVATKIKANVYISI